MEGDTYPKEEAIEQAFISPYPMYVHRCRDKKTNVCVFPFSENRAVVYLKLPTILRACKKEKTKKKKKEQKKKKELRYGQ
ncbi:hypothetical protein POVWA2_023720 [Plasmodium ovale wallikeri]|uniref:Uncharacterized protein n=1 Tax=Plasmodium ovale wallikeri TaxID=864142 RepID=A0A1A8YU55_PLAOA|nr:hypothetical protein POVWA2_023720 [Plasmodium ovale wallikeri]